MRKTILHYGEKTIVIDGPLSLMNPLIIIDQPVFIHETDVYRKDRDRLALFNEILSTYIATEELREQYRQKWQQLL